IWAALIRRHANGPRWASLVMAMLLGCVPLTLFRVDGVMGEIAARLIWRWTPDPEQQLLSQGPEKMVAPPVVTATVQTAMETSAKLATDGPDKKTTTAHPAQPVELKEAEWPGFRGPDRNGAIHGVQIKSDWTASPPVKMWERGVGPGWSSFAVQGDLFYTQEQR